MDETTMKDDKLISLKEVLAEIDAMSPVKAEGHEFIEKICLKTRLEFLPPADYIKTIKLSPIVQPRLTCDGCRYNGYYKHIQCRNCLRRERDLYEPE